MDAPGPDTGAPAPLPASTSGFPSPNREKIHQLPKFKDDRTRITFGIQQALPEAVRRSVRDNWEKCLVGSDFHQAFVVRSRFPPPPCLLFLKGTKLINPPLPFPSSTPRSTMPPQPPSGEA